MHHRIVSALAVCAVVAMTTGCGFSEGIHTSFGNCSLSPEALASIDWSTAPVIDLTIDKDGEYTPMILHFDRGVPATLRVFNASLETHMVNAPGFLDTAAIDTARLGSAEVSGECLDVLVLAPKDTATVRLVPFEAGRFVMTESYFRYPVWGTGEGVVYVGRSFDWRP